MKRTGTLLQKGIIIALVLLPVVAMAATLPNPTPPVSGYGVTVSEVLGLINQVARWLIGIALVIATIMIIWGGIRLMFASGEEATVKGAWQRINGGVIGAVIVLGVGVILQTIANLWSRQILN
jgi:hypothetical protein